ncbi:hypothetical protein [Symbiopectobacterium sp. RP]|uniref:hypothetical protein n=1 Tax=Symbiopectobacterium sp. RP TaxID=3248553 RepID=UPI003D2CB926
MITISCIFLPHIRALAVIIFKSVGYNSRNLEIVMQSPAMAARIDALYAQLWNSDYAQLIQLDKDYPAPRPGGAH